VLLRLQSGQYSDFLYINFDHRLIDFSLPDPPSPKGFI